MEIKDLQPFLAYLKSVRRRTRAVAECIPEELLEVSATPGRFAPGDIVRHIAAAERWMFAENVQLGPSRYPGHGPELAEGKAEVLAYLDQTRRETVSILEHLPPGRLEERCRTVGDIELTVWKWLRAMVEHEIHHRGQLYELLGQMGVPTPSLYGLTEPEVLARSQPR